jgi:hypothetical protein
LGFAGWLLGQLPHQLAPRVYHQFFVNGGHT